MADIDLRIPEKLTWLLSKPKRVKIAVGGRGSAKSTGVGDIMLMLADHGSRICCTREFQNSIDDSVHESLKNEIERLELEGFEPMANEIRTHSGGEVFYKGLARNITSLKSIAGVNYLWIEEGESVSTRSLKILTPSVRSAAGDEGDPPEIWITMNRGSTEDAIAEKYLSRAEESLGRTGYYEDDLMMVVEMNWDENPWFPPELEQERLDDLENLSRAEYDHIWGGDYYDTVENAIIDPAWFDASIDAHIKLGFKPLGAKIVSHDPADMGKDAKGLVYRHGSVILEALESTKGDVNDAMDDALDYAIDVGADWFIWDADGMGRGLRKQVASALDGKPIKYHEFGGGETPLYPGEIYEPIEGEERHNAKSNKEYFKNRRAQGYGYLRDRFLNTYKAVVKGEYIDPDKMISISSECSNIKKFRAEVCRIPKKRNANGMFQIMTKDEMWNRHKIASPNIADPAMMGIILPDQVKKPKGKIKIPPAKTAFG